MELNRRHLLLTAGATAAATGLTAVGGETASAAGRRHVTTGAQAQADQNWSELRGQRVGVITNPTGVLDDLTSIVDDMHARRVNVVGVFGPEHGFRGTAQAGDAEGTTTDPRTGIKVYDAYGATVDKLVSMFTDAKVQTVVFDIQDVGARFYTYIWTMYSAMCAAARIGARFVVLDRPNPVGGTARGPMMTSEFTSGVGAELIVQAHGMTVGELARMFNAEYLPLDTDGRRIRHLDVVRCRGWRRDELAEQTGLAWVPPSPNMPTSDTALLYPGTGLFEGTVLSEGRGTTRPFEIIGAPFVDQKWAEALNRRRLRGVQFREMYFIPTFSKWEKKVCGGVQVHLTDRSQVDAIKVAVEMLVAAKKLYPDFAWREDSWDTKRPFWVDKLTGSTRLREQIDAGDSAAEVVAAWRGELAVWNRRRRPYLLYR